MRGKLGCSEIDMPSNGITPADAGKTSIGYGSSRVSEDHPRGCGENKKRDTQDEYTIGSPPRMRGKQLNRLTVKCRDGITPADAGKTPSHGRDAQCA